MSCADQLTDVRYSSSKHNYQCLAVAQLSMASLQFCTTVCCFACNFVLLFFVSNSSLGLRAMRHHCRERNFDPSTKRSKPRSFLPLPSLKRASISTRGIRITTSRKFPASTMLVQYIRSNRLWYDTPPSYHACLLISIEFKGQKESC